MDELLKQIADLIAGAKDVDHGKLAAAFNKAESLQPLYTNIFNAGHRTATAQDKARQDEHTAALKQMQEKLDAAQSKIEEMGKGTPDITALTKQYEAALTGKATEQQKLQAEYDQKLADLNAMLGNERRSRTEADVVSYLAKRNVHPDYAAVLLQKPEVRERLRSEDNGASYRPYQADGKTPIPVPEGLTPLEAFAQSLIPSVPELFLIKKSPDATGVNGNGPDGGGRSYTPEQISKMSDKEYAEWRKTAGMKDIK